MIRCVHLWTDGSGNSRYAEGVLEFGPGPHGDLTTPKLPSTSVSFEETKRGGSLDWHTAPARQLIKALESMSRCCRAPGICPMKSARKPWPGS